MGKKSSGPHTIASMEHVASQLRLIADQIEATAALAAIAPAVPELAVPLEASLIDGMKFMQQWADSLRDAVRDAKRQHALNGKGVSVSPASVSDSPATPAKPRRK